VVLGPLAFVAPQACGPRDHGPSTDQGPRTDQGL